MFNLKEKSNKRFITASSIKKKHSIGIKKSEDTKRVIRIRKSKKNKQHFHEWLTRDLY
jgi:hypothetical protein